MIIYIKCWPWTTDPDEQLTCSIMPSNRIRIIRTPNAEREWDWLTPLSHPISSTQDIQDE